MDIKSKLYVTKVFDNDLVTIRKSKVTYLKICVLDLGKLLMHEFNHNYIKNKYGN